MRLPYTVFYDISEGKIDALRAYFRSWHWSSS